MSEVKRYNPELEKDIGLGLPCLSMMGNPYGEWVKWQDYAALKAELDALAAENAALKVLADACSREYESPKTEACDDDEKVAYPEEQCNITFGMIRSAARTPVTDAYLNSVRAEGVDKAAMKIRKATGAFKDIHHGAVNECADIAEMVAAQLRAGEPS